MDLGDFAYLIFLVIAGVINFWGKKRKKNANKPAQQRPQQKSRSIEDLIAQWVDVPEEKPEVKVQNIQEEAPDWALPAKETQPSSTKGTFYTKKEHSKPTKRATQKVVLPLDEQEEVTEGIEFDVHQAIIYSEILRRPDF